MEENKSIIEAEFNGLKELLNEKLSNLCKEMARNNATLTEHNGRLRTMEKIVEQGKGAGKTIVGFWSLVGGTVGAVIVYFLTKHL
jgi:hypothetical protein